MRILLLLSILFLGPLWGGATSLHLISSKGDPIGKGKRYCYESGDGEFHITGGEGQVSFKFKQEGEWWTVHFEPPEGELLLPGLYKNGIPKQYKIAAQPVLTLSGSFGCGWEGVGNFEILEMKLENNKVESFAAHFFEIGKQVKNPPIFGSIRYNSDYPLVAEMKDICGIRKNPKSSLFLTYAHEDTSCIITDREYKFKYNEYNEFEEGLIIEIGKKKDGSGEIEHLRLEIYTSAEEGLYPGLESKPLHGNIALDPIRFIVDGEEHHGGSYKIFNIKKDKHGKIKELALNFIFPEWNEIQGAIRYNSSLPVNYHTPYF